MSVNEIVANYNISSYHVVKSWIEKYNANEKLRDYDPKREVYMAESRRKTTKEERLEIARYCLDHDRDYKGTATLYSVSYSQVYSWVKKFCADGENGLNDRRGHHKTDDEVDELERLRRENNRLKRQLKEQDMTVELLKKSQRIRKEARLGKLRYESKYLTIQYFHRERQWSISWMCRKLEITRAAYYKWLSREIPAQEKENIQLAELIREYDEYYCHILGFRRMTAWINHFNGTHYSKNRVHRIRMQNLCFIPTVVFNTHPRCFKESLQAKEWNSLCPGLGTALIMVRQKAFGES